MAWSGRLTLDELPEDVLRHIFVHSLSSSDPSQSDVIRLGCIGRSCSALWAIAEDIAQRHASARGFDTTERYFGWGWLHMAYRISGGA
jgi:hypothetical protein